jgi:hypothetical protein
MSMTRFSCVFAVLFLAGCGEKGPTVGTAQGKLTIGGKAPPYPVAVIFANSSQGQASSGATKEDGTYELYGDVKTGEYTVYLEKIVNSDGPISTGKLVLSIVPKEFRTEDTSPLKKTINEGKNTIDIDVPLLESASK